MRSIAMFNAILFEPKHVNPPAIRPFMACKKKVVLGSHRPHMQSEQEGSQEG